MLELRAGRTSEYADQEMQANENVAKKAAMISEKKRRVLTLRFWHSSAKLTYMIKNDVDNE